jgi:hypothetical protein
MAIDNPHRQGVLYDEVYFVSLWAGRGTKELMTLLDAAGMSEQLRTPSDRKLDPRRLLGLAITSGHPPSEVRHLL